MIPGAGNDIIRFKQFQLSREHAQHVFRHLFVINKAHQLPFFTLLQALGNFLQVAFRNVVIQVQFGIARKLYGIRIEGVGFEDGKYFTQGIADYIVEQDDIVFFSFRR
jgi:hypothetical protein